MIGKQDYVNSGDGCNTIIYDSEYTNPNIVNSIYNVSQSIYSKVYIPEPEISIVENVNVKDFTKRSENFQNNNLYSNTHTTNKVESKSVS